MTKKNLQMAMKFGFIILNLLGRYAIKCGPPKTTQEAHGPRTATILAIFHSPTLGRLQMKFEQNKMLLVT